MDFFSEHFCLSSRISNVMSHGATVPKSLNLASRIDLAQIKPNKLNRNEMLLVS